MNVKVILGISVTHLLARRKQSMIAGLGVTFGIMMFISLVSFMTGLNELLDGLILNRTPHIRLYNEIRASELQPVEQVPEFMSGLNYISSIKPKDVREEIYNSMPIMQALDQDNRVIGYSPKVSTQVFYTAGEIELNGVIDGIDILQEDRLFKIGDYIVKGEMRDLMTVNNSVILGAGLAKKMMVDIGDVVQTVTAKGDFQSLKVVGIYQSGLADVDNIQSFSTIGTVQKIKGKSSSYITDINIKLTDLNLAPAVAKEFHKTFNADAIDIQTANAQFETGTSIRNIITYAVSITLLIVAGFGIYNILNMMIYEKMDDIAILKATGFSGTDVQWVFIFQALIIGIAGGILGLIFGFLISLVISHTPFETQALPTIKTFPVNFEEKFYGIGIVFALVTTYFAGYFPSRKAGKIDPVEIIRGK
jgi:lipoprotein-releasing system permease protein